MARFALREALAWQLQRPHGDPLATTSQVVQCGASPLQFRIHGLRCRSRPSTLELMGLENATGMGRGYMNGKTWLAIIGAAGAVLAAAIPAAIGALKSTPPPAPGIVIQGNDGIYAPGGTVNSIKTTVNNFTQVWVDGANIIVRSLRRAPVPESRTYPTPEPAVPRSGTERQPGPAAPSQMTTPSTGATQPSQPQPPPVAPPPEPARISTDARSAPCILVCLAGDCRFATLGSVPMELKVGRVRQVSDCRTVGILDGEFGLRYRRKGLWSGPPGVIRNNTSVAQVLDAFPPDSCAMISPRCLQERMQTKPRPDLGPHFSESMRRNGDTPSSALFFLIRNLPQQAHAMSQ